MARPKGTDGSDHESKMLIEKKYKTAVETRKKLHMNLVFLTVYHSCRILWEILPWHEGIPEAEVVKYILFLGVVSIICGFAALKTRKPLLFKLFSLTLTIITIGEIMDVIVSRQNRYLMIRHRDGFVRLVHKAFPKWDGGLISVFGDMIEGILAMGGILVHGSAIFLTNRLLAATELKRD